MRGTKMNKLIDHTLLKPDATKLEIDQLCEEAIQYDFASVCVNPYWVSFCKHKLKQTDVKVCTVIGFPLGSTTSKVKALECLDAIENGADEIDMVINIGALKDHNDEIVYNDIKAVVDVANGNCVKVILETCLLSDEEIVRACNICVKAHATFVKTSTGFSKEGANPRVVKLMKDTVGKQAKVKAAGGVRSQADLLVMIEAGAERIGTSAGVTLMKQQEVKTKY